MSIAEKGKIASVSQTAGSCRGDRARERNAGKNDNQKR